MLIESALHSLGVVIDISCYFGPKLNLSDFALFIISVEINARFCPSAVFSLSLRPHDLRRSALKSEFRTYLSTKRPNILNIW